MIELSGVVRRVALVLLPVLLLPAGAPANPWEPVERPGGLAPQRVLVKKKPRVYFRVTDRAPIEVTVQGPARIKVVSRAEAPAGAARTVSYSVRIAEGGRVLKAHTTESGPAPDARLAGRSGTSLCKSRSFTLAVPDGTHRLSLSVTGVPTLYARILVAAPKRRGEEMISITPVEAPRSVTISEGERLIPYYTAIRGKPVRLRIIGPTQLELSARLDYDPTMRGAQRYVIRIGSGGRPLREVRLRTTKAVAASYTDLKDRVPSKLDRIVLPLGPGLHELTVDLVEPRTGAAEIHARIPKPSVGNEE